MAGSAGAPDTGPADAGTAARRRVAATLQAAPRVELGRLIVGPPGPGIEAARRRALEAAQAAGRSGLIAEARDAAIADVSRAFAAKGFSGTWAMTEMAMSVARPADRAAIAEALADAVTADAVADLVDEDTAGALRATWATIATASVLPEPGSLSSFTSAVARVGGHGRTSLAGAILLLLLGVAGIAFASALGIAFLAAGLVVLRNALRGRPA